MNLEEAALSHTEWKVRFRTAIKERRPMDSATISKDNLCEIGKWLKGEVARAHAALPSYQTCLAAHTAFHVEAGKVAAVISAQKFEEAEAMLAGGTPYMAASKAVVVALLALKKDAAL